MIFGSAKRFDSERQWLSIHIYLQGVFILCKLTSCLAVQIKKPITNKLIAYSHRRPFKHLPSFKRNTASKNNLLGHQHFKKHPPQKSEPKLVSIYQGHLPYISTSLKINPTNEERENTTVNKILHFRLPLVC